MRTDEHRFISICAWKDTACLVAPQTAPCYDLSMIQAPPPKPAILSFAAFPRRLALFLTIVFAIAPHPHVGNAKNKTPTRSHTATGSQSTAPSSAQRKHLPDDLSRAEKVWEVSLGSHQYGVPTIASGRIYLALNDRGLSDPRIQRTDGGLVMCLDLATGKTLWKLAVPRFTNPRGEPHYFDH